MIEMGPFQQDDRAVLLDLTFQAVPFVPQENIEWPEYRRNLDESEWIEYRSLSS
jgi:hypothetical protein